MHNGLVLPSSILALFAGAAGLELGLHAGCEQLGGPLARPRTVCYVEREAYAAAVLVARMEDQALDFAPIHADVCSFDGRPWRGIVDCISGGFPCQDISKAGKGAGITGARSGLWKQYARIVGEVRPRFVFIENVALLQKKGLDVVLGDLAEMGFSAEWGCFRASDAGAPHRRERMFILAYSDRGGRDLGTGNVPVQARGHEPADLGSALAHAHAHGHGLGLVRSPGLQHGIGPARGGDPDRCGRTELEHAPGRGAVPAQQRGRGDGSLAPGEELEHAHDPRLEGRLLHDGGRGRLPGSTGTPRAHPPGPEDVSGWLEVLETHPELEPAVCRMVDELAGRLDPGTRTDRLRLTGNGVHPGQAALAFTTLYRNLCST